MSVVRRNSKKSREPNPFRLSFNGFIGKAETTFKRFSKSRTSLSKANSESCINRLQSSSAWKNRNHSVSGSGSKLPDCVVVEDDDEYDVPTVKADSISSQSVLDLREESGAPP
ncbi:unnamed protein product [Dimorphilus gyrociliatus]|uniref:Uncharacterized protein n=1 Tax=Dimorphilus gyrociliatus TaxID=2664684 RepID=A0A7I8VZJ6_9ANNE|nr:unnamed protein product [Dimorphilus gyrociliatus]